MPKGLVWGGVGELGIEGISRCRYRSATSLRAGSRPEGVRPPNRTLVCSVVVPWEMNGCAIGRTLRTHRVSSNTSAESLRRDQQSRGRKVYWDKKRRVDFARALIGAQGYGLLRLRMSSLNSGSARRSSGPIWIKASTCSREREKLVGRVRKYVRRSGSGMASKLTSIT
jgi:hypothetical protein